MRVSLLSYLLWLLLGRAEAAETVAENTDSATPSITLKLSPNLQALFTFSTVLKPSDTDPAHRSFFHNEDGSLVGCTLRPATQTGYVFLFVTRRNGDVLVMQDFSDRLERLFRKPPTGFAADCIVLEGISGRTLSLSSSTHSRVPSVNFRVRVGDDGTLTLLRP